jgi:enoyl-CoA hydratase
MNTNPISIPDSDVITVEAEGHVATVWLDRPDKLNALGISAWEDLPQVMDALGSDDGVRVIVIAARGRAFTVGIDLMAFAPAFTTGSFDPDVEAGTVAARLANYASIKRLQDSFTALARCPKPVIAAIHGFCLGAGIDLITACDIRLASRDAIFSVRETKIAMVADVGTLQRLPRIVDPGRVAELVYTGKDFGAVEAHEMGLVSHLYEDGDAVQQAAGALAAEIAANSPLAVQGSKAVLRAAEGQSIDTALDYVALWNAAFIHSNDFAEAVTAFLEKRNPDFTGT